MTTISSLGIGSGLDLSSLLQSLQSAENAPLQAIQKQQSSYNAKLSAYGQLQSALSALQTAASNLSESTLFQGVTASSSATGVLGVSSDSTAVAGSYAVNVTQLAQAQTVVATGVASSSAAIGNGTVTIQFGTISGGVLDGNGQYSGATFTADASRSAESVTIDASNNTLTGIRDAINADSALGVTATIVNDGSGTPYRLVLTSTTTGETSSMNITVAGDAALSNLLANDPAGTQNMQQTVAAQNASLTVNGIAVTSTTNSVQDAIQGVTMTLASAGASTVAVTKDTASMTTAINAFVSAYNSLHSTASKLSAYDATNKSGSILLGDSTLQSIESRIRNLLNTPQTSGTMTVLSEVGLSIALDGTMTVDSTKLSAALDSDLDGVASLFSGVSGSGGYGRQMDDLIDGFTSTGGLLTAAQDGVNSTLKSLDKDYSKKQDQIDARMAYYKNQFTQLDRLVSQMNQTSSYLTQQLASLSSKK